jgi:cytidyltransferase-like protein
MSKDLQNKSKKNKIIMVSGGFDPVHIGHVRMFEEAKNLGDELVVVLNNDNWLMVKKGFVFMPEADRKEILEAFRAIDRVVLTSHKPNTKDISVCHEIESIRPDIFANGGDRKYDNIPEYELCERLGIEMVFNVGHGGKIRSSSDLVKLVKKHNL